MPDIALLLISLGIILIGAEVFTNAVEWLGHRYELSEGAVGSVLAAVGTALPETMIPLIAFIVGGGSSKDIGIGAILGAPLMLSTLAMLVTGMAVVIFQRRRRFGTKVVADVTVINRDLGIFLLVFAAAILNGIFPHRTFQYIIAGLMVLAYVWYVFVTLQEERGEVEGDMRACYFAPRSPEPAKALLWLQLLFALGMIVGGADLFVNGIEHLARVYGVPAFVLALVIAPIATELPEKFNSVIWISRGKDTLALGNITGAMVFQSSIIPAIGVIFTPWHLTTGGIITGLLALTAAFVMYLESRRNKSIRAATLFAAGSLYFVFLVLVLERIIR
ncbi:MAG: sodium:calcium antiporter [Candidatus Saccharibacteria bacterium]